MAHSWENIGRKHLKRGDRLTDKKIHAAIIKRDEGTMAMVIQKYSRLLWSIVSAILLNAASEFDVEEVVADVFIYFWNHPEKYDPDRGKLTTWLSVVARTKAIDRYRQITRKQEVPYEVETMASRMEPLTGVIAKEEKEKLIDCLEDLAEADREVILRRYYYDQKPSEIACALHLSKKQVENQLYQAKLRLRKKMEAWQG